MGHFFICSCVALFSKNSNQFLGYSECLDICLSGFKTGGKLRVTLLLSHLMSPVWFFLNIYFLIFLLIIWLTFSTLFSSQVSFFMTITFNSLSGIFLTSVSCSSIAVIFPPVLCFGTYPSVSSFCLSLFVSMYWECHLYFLILEIVILLRRGAIVTCNFPCSSEQGASGMSPMCIAYLLLLWLSHICL